MKMKDLEAKIEEVLSLNPKLNYEGIALPQVFKKRETPSQRQERLQTLRDKLLTAEGVHEVKLVVKWLKTSKRARRTKLMNTRYSSFGLKTYVESDTGSYISNGSFIVGAMICGCKAEQVKTSENAILNLRIR
tara:strand:- start:3619 stop:4017 length:399 start_codon:yes stop_codon:yes gene_type:complete